MSRPRSTEADRAILAASAAVVAARGYAGASIEAIADTAGVGKTTIYRRWPSKPALMAAAYADLVPPDNLHADTGRFAGDVRHLLGALFRRYRETPAARILAGLIADAQDDPETMAALTGGIIDGRRNILASAIERALARGERLVSEHADEVCDLIVALVWHRLLTEPGGLDTAHVERIIRMAGARENDHG